QRGAHPTMSVSIWKNLNLQCAFSTQFMSAARESVLKLARSLMEQEVAEKAGGRYERRKASKGRKKGDDELRKISRAGSDPGTIRVAHQRVLVRKPRLKDSDGKEVPLQSYQGLRKSDLLTARVLDCMIRGLSTRDYGDLVDEISGGLGLSKSSV